MKKATFIGVSLLLLTITCFGQTNVLTGANAGTSLTTAGINNVFTGVRAGQLSTTANKNVFAGFEAGRNNIIGSDNVFAGYQAGLHNTESNNVYVGTAAGRSNKQSFNVFLGSQAGMYGVSGFNNVFTGHKAGLNNNGSRNVFLGFLSGYEITTGVGNVFVGSDTGANVIGGSNNTFVGANAGSNSAGSSCVFLGNSAGTNETQSNRLSIANSYLTTPLIYGKFKNTQGGTSEENQVGINTTNIPSGFAFAVKGKVITEEVNVAIQGSGIWPDYVFDADYKLPSLKEVEKHIIENGHLQNIPSAAEVSESGIFLGDMNVKLLQKIEELTLYSIQQQKELEYLKAENEKYKSLAERLSAIEKELKK